MKSRHLLFAAPFLGPMALAAQTSFAPSPNVTSPEEPAAAEAESAVPAGPYFFKNRGYGTDAYGGPLDVILNKAYATAPYSGRNRAIFDYAYGWRSVWASVSSPLDAVDRYGGWWRFIRREVIPYPGGGWKSYRWMPNYFGHAIEGGIIFRRSAEWYAAYGVPMPSVLAAITTYSAAVINEAYESPGDELPKGATVADLLIFDPLGIALFWSDDVARFFAHDLRATVWPRMGSLRVDDAWVINNGEDLVFKLPIGLRSTRFFFKTGLGIQAGLTHTLSNGIDLSWGFGNDMRRQFVDPVTGEEDADIELSLVLFVDRDNNLLWSVHWSETSWRVLTVNVYPGIISVGGISPGVWTVVERSGAVNFGITASQTLGLGIGKLF